MTLINRRAVLGTGATIVVGAAAEAREGDSIPQPIMGEMGATDLGPRNLERDRQNPNLLTPPSTDKGLVPNLRFSFSDAHMNIQDGGWAREVTQRELPIATEMSGVNMRLEAGAAREMHWHKQAEWSIMLAGSARITAVDDAGKNFIADVQAGDLWYFPAGIPHSIQGLGPEGCEFLLAFPDGSFSESSTFLLSELFARTPKDVLAKNFGVAERAFENIPEEQLFIFQAGAPAPPAQDAVASPQGTVPRSMVFSLMAGEPIRSPKGSVRIADSTNFPVSTDVAASLVEIEPDGMREIHWHTNADEWQYYIAGQGRMTVFASENASRTFDFREGDVGYVPRSFSHYVENTGDKPLRYLELFRANKYVDVSLNQWLALTPPALVKAHLKINDETTAALRKVKRLVA